jgi:hypothetical protein
MTNVSSRKHNIVFIPVYDETNYFLQDFSLDTTSLEHFTLFKNILINIFQLINLSETVQEFNQRISEGMEMRMVDVISSTLIRDNKQIFDKAYTALGTSLFYKCIDYKILEVQVDGSYSMDYFIEDVTTDSNGVFVILTRDQVLI